MLNKIADFSTQNIKNQYFKTYNENLKSLALLGSKQENYILENLLTSLFQDNRWQVINSGNAHSKFFDSLAKEAVFLQSLDSFYSNKITSSRDDESIFLINLDSFESDFEKESNLDSFPPNCSLHKVAESIRINSNNDDLTAILRNLEIKSKTVLATTVNDTTLLVENLKGFWQVSRFSSQRNFDFDLQVFEGSNKKSVLQSSRYFLPHKIATIISLYEVIKENYLSIDRLCLKEKNKNIEEILPADYFVQKKVSNFGNLIYQADQNNQTQVLSFLSEIRLFINYIQKIKQEGGYEELKMYKSDGGILPPRHLLVINRIPGLDKSEGGFGKVFEQIEKLRQSDYLQGVIFVGEDWLRIDQDKVPKSQGAVRYFSYKKKLFKNLKNNEHFWQYLQKEDFPPNLRIWVKDNQDRSLETVL